MLGAPTGSRGAEILTGQGEERLRPPPRGSNQEAPTVCTGVRRAWSREASTQGSKSPLVFQKVLARPCASAQGRGWAAGMEGLDALPLRGAQAARPAAPTAA